MSQLKLKPSRSLSKNSIAPAKLYPVNLSSSTPAAVSAAHHLMAFYRNALQFILIWTAVSLPISFCSAKCREITCRRKIYGMIERVSESLSEWIRRAAQTPSLRRHGWGRPDSALCQRAKLFRKRYQTFGTRSWPAR